MTRNPGLSRGLSVVTAMALLGIAGGTLAAQEEFSWNGSIEADEWMTVQNINGDVEVVVTNGSTIELVATKRGDADDFHLVTIEVVEGRDGVTVCAIYPSRKRNDTQDCGNEEIERQRRRGNTDVEVEFVLRVPAGTQLKGSTVNGDVIVNGTLRNAVTTTVNGDVEVASRGSLTATTVNGSVDARLDGNDLDGPVTLTTVNGSIHLDINDGLNADIEARWVSGGLRSEVPLTVRGRMSRSASGTLGAGGHEVSLTTVNGSIEIR
jgi:DUF4097 and DUF4098 domain-containing protein YvlB